MLQKYTALFLSLLLLMLPVSSVQADEAAASPLEKVMLLWENYLSAKDQLLKGEILLSDTVIAFCDSHTWEDLLRARAAASAVLSKRSEIGDIHLSPVLSNADYIALSADGIEIEVIRSELPELNTYLSDDLLSLLDWNLSLYISCFDVDSLKWLRTRAALQKQSALYECQWQALATNALLVSLNDEKTASAFWQNMETLCPTIAANRNEYITDDTLITSAASSLMDTMEAQLVDYNNHLGAGRNDLNDMAYAISVGDPYFTPENTVIIENAPIMLPMPEWFIEDIGSSIYVGYTSDADGNMVRMTIDSDFSILPEYLVIYTSDVDKQTVVDYGNYLSDIKLEYTQSGSDADSSDWMRTYFVGSSLLMLSWQNGNASIWMVDSPALLIPDWYLMMMLQMRE
jgi:hypothetical protein